MIQRMKELKKLLEEHGFKVEYYLNKETLEPTALEIEYRCGRDGRYRQFFTREQIEYSSLPVESLYAQISRTTLDAIGKSLSIDGSNSWLGCKDSNLSLRTQTPSFCH